MGKIIELKNVFKSYGKKKVLEKVSFSLDEGQFITMIGCNGAGKSTTLRLMAGVENVEQGEVTALDKNPYHFNYPFRSDLFFIHEHVAIVNTKSLLEMVKIYRTVFPRWDNKVFNQHLKERKISLKKSYAELSRGQKMQFLLMVGLAANPKVMLLDEITAVIDIEGQKYFLDQLKNYTSRGGTVVITTNILSELNDYTDHLLLLQDTSLMVNERVSELRKKFIMLKQTAEHEIFSHPKAAKLRKDHDGKMLYIIPRSLIDEDTFVTTFIVDYPPRLEDILVLHFKLKTGGADEELVA
jgi:ABC-2 type transport system ATP-binding protein